jgi:acetyl esterase/lipase
MRSAFTHPDVLETFQPTLIMTATSALEMSAAVYSRGQLRKAGVDAELYVLDGLWHGFAGDPSLPESIDFQNAIVSFFNRQLGR